MGSWHWSKERERERQTTTVREREWFAPFVLFFLPLLSRCVFVRTGAEQDCRNYRHLNITREVKFSSMCWWQGPPRAGRAECAHLCVWCRLYPSVTMCVTGDSMWRTKKLVIATLRVKKRERRRQLLQTYSQPLSAQTLQKMTSHRPCYWSGKGTNH